VFFFGNKDLRRILTDYGFKGFPLRKDFPLTGYVDVYYDDNQKRICYRNLELSQEYRNFNFSTK
jgi:NADH-quinone oxidoreductase subunit C